jgi:hypothetical protein
VSSSLRGLACAAAESFRKKELLAPSSSCSRFHTGIRRWTGNHWRLAFSVFQSRIQTCMTETVIVDAYSEHRTLGWHERPANHCPATVYHTGSASRHNESEPEAVRRIGSGRGNGRPYAFRVTIFPSIARRRARTADAISSSQSIHMHGCRHIRVKT